MSYDNTDSGLSSTDVQDAIDEVNSGKINSNNYSYNVWFPQIYDYNTYVKTLTSNECVTRIIRLGKLTVANLQCIDATKFGTISTMLQFRGFPSGCTECIGGTGYSASASQQIFGVQESDIAVYFRPNLTSLSSNFSCVLFFI